MISRQLGESLLIGNEIKLIIIDVRGDKVRLGIEAPNSIPVHTREVYDAIQREKRETEEKNQKVQYELAIRVDHNGSLRPVFLGSDGTVVNAGRTMRLISGIYIRARMDLSDILAELEELINNPNTMERDIQRFFEKHPHLLKTDESDIIIPQARIARIDGKDWQMDFFLKPFDDIEFCRILELKLPTLRLEPKRRSGHTLFCTKLLRAINQLKDYGRAFQSDKAKDAFRRHYGVDVGRPELHLIAGRRIRLPNITELQRIQMEEGVIIHDYDSLLKTLRRKIR